jgi:putative ABC transport system permease protein
VQTIYASSATADVSQQASDEISQVLRKQHRLNPDGTNDDFSIRTQAELISTMDLQVSYLGIICYCRDFPYCGWNWYYEHYVCFRCRKNKRIGLRMSIGARGKDILLQFLIEAVNKPYRRNYWCNTGNCSLRDCYCISRVAYLYN